MKNRNYGIDLLRIVSMYMIVILHVLGQGGILDNVEVLSLKYNLSWLLKILCYCCVNCYALITGYVMVDSNFKYKKIFNLLIEVLFWSLLLTTIMKFIYPDLVGKKDFLKSIFNVTFNSYWYFSSYFALFFFIPFINKLISVLDKILYKRLVLTIIILMSFINLVTDPFKLSSGYSLIWLVSLYFIGAYIKKYNIGKGINRLYMLIGIFIAVLITLFSKLILVKYPDITFGFFCEGILVNYTSFTILFISLVLLIIFSNFRISNKYFKRFIRRVAPATFGVYIIHVQPIVWNLFVKGLFKFLVEYNLFEMISMILILAFVMYMLCSYLEMFRIFIFRKFKLFVLGDFLYDFVRGVLKKLKLYEEVKDDINYFRYSR